MNDDLQAALNAMYKNLLFRRKHQEHTPDENIKRVVNCCHNFFLNMRTAYLKYNQTDDLCLPNDAIQALFDAGFIMPTEHEQKGTFKLSKKMQHIFAAEIAAGIDKVFPNFSYEPYPLENILSSTEPSVVMLPYLLSSYYLNRHKNRNWFASIEKYFTSDPEYFSKTTEDHFSRNVGSFLNIFSSERFLRNLAKRKRQPIDKKDGADERDMKKVTEVYTDFLKKGPMTQFHYIQLYKAFVYFTCAAICANELPLEIIEKIDFKSSWSLFDSHTLAFRTIYCSEQPWPEFDVDDDIDSSIGDAMFLDLDCEIPYELYKESKEQLKAYGVNLKASGCYAGGLSSHEFFYQPSKSIEVKCAEQNLYINQAIVCSAIGNPLVHPHLCDPEKLIRNLLHCVKLEKGVKIFQMLYL